MSSILLCCPMTSKADVGVMAAEVEHSHQYSITFYWHVTDGSRGAVWQNGIWHRSAYEAKVCHWIPPCKKNSTHWYSLTLAECFWGPNSGCEHSENVGDMFQQWRLRQWIIPADTIFDKHCMQALVHHCWKYTASSDGCVEK